MFWTPHTFFELGLYCFFGARRDLIGILVWVAVVIAVLRMDKMMDEADEGDDDL